MTIIMNGSRMERSAALNITLNAVVPEGFTTGVASNATSGPPALPGWTTAAQCPIGLLNVTT